MRGHYRQRGAESDPRSVSSTPRSLSHSALVALVLLGLGALSGCAAEPVAVQLSWLLGDGSTCEEAAIESVVVEIEGSATSAATYPCADGFAPSTLDLGDFESGIVELRLRAVDGDGVARYEASARLDLRDDPTLARIQLSPVAP